MVALKGAKVEWVEKFVELEGVFYLTKHLGVILKKRTYVTFSFISFPTE